METVGFELLSPRVGCGLCDPRIPLRGSWQSSSSLECARGWQEDTGASGDVPSDGGERPGPYPGNIGMSPGGAEISSPGSPLAPSAASVPPPRAGLEQVRSGDCGRSLPLISS